MHIWDWQIFWNEFALEVLAASAILSGLVMLAVWAWTLERKVVFLGSAFRRYVRRHSGCSFLDAAEDRSGSALF